MKMKHWPCQIYSHSIKILPLTIPVPANPWPVPLMPQPVFIRPISPIRPIHPSVPLPFIMLTSPSAQA
jgi:hypothetical protein